MSSAELSANDPSRVGIAGMGLWMPGYADVATWLSGEPDAEAVKPLGLALDRRNRRRGSQLGRSLSDALTAALAQAEVDVSTTPTVVGSAIGEAVTLVGLLSQIWRTVEPASPAAFSVSVHNAAAGLISISNKNQGFSSALSADCDTPATSLLEAVGLVATTGVPVAVVCGDEPVPTELVPADVGWQLQAGAMVLVPLDGTHSCLAQLKVTLGGQPDLSPAVFVDEAQARNPQAGMIDLITAVARGQRGVLRLDRGAGRGYCAEISEASEAPGS